MALKSVSFAIAASSLIFSFSKPSPIIRKYQGEIERGYNYVIAEIEHALPPLGALIDGSDDTRSRVYQILSEKSVADELLTGNYAMPSVYGYASGKIDDNIFLAPSGDITFADNRSVIGKPVVVAGSDDYLEGLTLNFNLAAYATVAGVGDFSDFAVYKMGADGTYEHIEANPVAETGLACALNGSGTYFVLDTAEFLKSFGINKYEYNPANNPEPDIMGLFSMFRDIRGQADIVFVINNAASMSAHADKVRSGVAALADRLSSDYKTYVNFALITYKDMGADGADSAQVVGSGISNWFLSASALADRLDAAVGTFDGGDKAKSCVDALEAARALDFRPTADKFVILITDSPYNTKTLSGDLPLEEAADRLAGDGICVSAITYGSGFTGYEKGNFDYSPLWLKTGGVYSNIHGDFGVGLLKIADGIGKKTTKGIWVILSRGYRRIKLPALPADHSSDTDGDGLSDMFELNILKPAYLDTGAVRVLFPAYYAYADPTFRDTDFDGVEDMHDKKPWEFPIACVKENVGYSIPPEQWKRVTPRYVNIYGRDKSAYNLILDQFDVENNARYSQTVTEEEPFESFTWCNIYVWDVTVAMNAEIPHYYNPIDGSGASSPGGGRSEMNADMIAAWLAVFGPRYGWREVTAAEAQKRADAGYPVVSAIPGGGHVLMICPAREGDTGLFASQAGGRNYRYSKYDPSAGLRRNKFYTHD